MKLEIFNLMMIPVNMVIYYFLACVIAFAIPTFNPFKIIIAVMLTAIFESIIVYLAYIWYKPKNKSLY